MCRMIYFPIMFKLRMGNFILRLIISKVFETQMIKTSQLQSNFIKPYIPNLNQLFKVDSGIGKDNERICLITQ